MLTEKQLMQCLDIKADRAAKWCGLLNSAMASYDITTPKRIAAFLSQIGHESGRLFYTSELWGPTKQQRGYEGRADLGNTQPGDGPKFRGHGLIQNTGRYNHRMATKSLRRKFGADVPDFEEFPDQLAEPKWAAYAAAEFWARNGLNKFADKGDCIAVSSIVNTGRVSSLPKNINGLSERLQIYSTCCSVLGV